MFRKEVIGDRRGERRRKKKKKKKKIIKVNKLISKEREK
jgi:hypothetical protein